ncbi:MAG: hypothetical protein V4732_07345 [Pseudomonadota bacterium]
MVYIRPPVRIPPAMAVKPIGSNEPVQEQQLAAAKPAEAPFIPTPDRDRRKQRDRRDRRNRNHRDSAQSDLDSGKGNPRGSDQRDPDQRDPGQKAADILLETRTNKDRRKTARPSISINV